MCVITKEKYAFNIVDGIISHKINRILVCTIAYQDLKEEEKNRRSCLID